jgi:hypothetical protein
MWAWFFTRVDREVLAVLSRDYDDREIMDLDYFKEPRTSAATTRNRGLREWVAKDREAEATSR